MERLRYDVATLLTDEEVVHTSKHWRDWTVYITLLAQELTVCQICVCDASSVTQPLS